MFFLPDVKIIGKFAYMEFNHGDASIAQTMYENLLNTYPKRWDVWTVYLDQMIKHDPSLVR